jgi:uncharacterized protein YpmS
MRKKRSGKTRQTKAKVLKIILISLIIFSLLFLFIFTYFLHLVFDPPQDYNAESLTQEHVLLKIAVIMRLTSLLYNGKPGRVSVLVLSQAEVNAIITAFSNSDSWREFLFSTGNTGNPPKKRPYKVVFNGNRFDIKYSFPTDFYTPFGKNINLTFSGKPELDKKGVHIDIKSISAGDVPLPPQQVEKILHFLLKDYEKDEIFKKIHEVVVKAYITPDNDLVIYFYPWRIRDVLTKGF